MPDPARKTLSATEMPALLGVSSYQTPWMLYQRFANGNEVQREADNRMKSGRRLQTYLQELAAEDLHLDVIPNEQDDYVARGLLGCTRDATVRNPDLGPIALENKAVFDYKVWMQKWDGGKTPPREHEIQLQQQMYVGDGETSFKGGILSAWVGGEQVYFEREPMPDLWAIFEQQAAEFFRRVAAKDAYDATGAAIEMPVLTKFFPPVKDNTLDLSQFNPDDPAQEAQHKAAMALAEDVRLWAWAAAERLGHEKTEKSIKARCQAVGAGHDKILLPHGIRVDLKSQKRAGYTVKPTEFVTVTAFVPDNIPEGQINGF